MLENAVIYSKKTVGNRIDLFSAPERKNES